MRASQCATAAAEPEERTDLRGRTSRPARRRRGEACAGWPWRPRSTPRRSSCRERTPMRMLKLCREGRMDERRREGSGRMAVQRRRWRLGPAEKPRTFRTSGKSGRPRRRRGQEAQTNRRGPSERAPVWLRRRGAAVSSMGRARAACRSDEIDGLSRKQETEGRRGAAGAAEATKANLGRSSRPERASFFALLAGRGLAR